MASTQKIALLVNIKDSDEYKAGEVILARQELPEGHTWGSNETGGDGAKFCVVYVEDDDELSTACHSENTIVSHPYSEWEACQIVTSDRDNPDDEFVHNTFKRVTHGGKTVPAKEIKQGACISKDALVETVKAKEDNVIGRKPVATTQWEKRPKQE